MKSKFTYNFVMWVLAKFHLPTLQNFATSNGFGAVYGWKTRGLPKGLFPFLQEKLINLKSMGNVNCKQSVNLDDLFEEYQIELKK